MLLTALADTHQAEEQCDAAKAIAEPQPGSQVWREVPLPNALKGVGERLAEKIGGIQWQEATGS